MRTPLRCNGHMKLSLHILCAALAAFCTLAISSPAHSATMVRGENRTCRDFADLDFALDRPSSDYFKGWTGKDFDDAEAWVTACTGVPPSTPDQTRQSLLSQRRRVLAGTGETARNEQAQAAAREETAAVGTALEAELKAQAARDAANNTAADRTMGAMPGFATIDSAARCEHTDAGQRFIAQMRVMEALDREAAAQDALDHEKRVEALSGVTNLAAQRNAAESLVAAQDEEHKWWRVYLVNGGSATNPQMLTRLRGDPCA
jgi:hypothetical protein